MSGTAADREELLKLVQALKERLLEEEPLEGILMELVRLEASISAMQADFERLDTKFRIFEAALLERDILIKSGEVITELPAGQMIAADHLLDAADGFYGLEHDPQGRPFRWTGPEPQFRFTLYVDRAAAKRLETSFLWACDPAMFPAIQCFVDRRAVPVRYETRGDAHVLLADVPARANADPGATTITFVLPKVVAAKNLNPGSGDDRTLGVAFREIRIGDLRAAGSREQVLPMIRRKGRPRE